MVRSGDKVNVKVTIKNTGTITHNFPIGCTMRSRTTQTDYDIPFQYESRSPGSSGSETFVWTIPINAKKETYDVITAVWEKVVNNLGVNRLDSETKSSAFSVT